MEVDEEERVYDYQQLVESDDEDAYPHLEKRVGTPFIQIPKKIVAYNKIKGDDTVLYLCTWHQDYKDAFYTPSFIPSALIRALS